MYRGLLNLSILCCVSRCQWRDSECDAAGLTLSQLQEGQYSHLAHGPEAAVTWGRKELSVPGKNTVRFCSAIQSLCFILYHEENGVSGVIQKKSLCLGKDIFLPFSCCYSCIPASKDEKIWLSRGCDITDGFFYSKGEPPLHLSDRRTET